MSLTILLSGPRSSESQARTALAARGFAVHGTDHDYGLSPHPAGEEIVEPQAFVTVDGDDVNLALGTVSPLGWHLRLHHESVPEPQPNPIVALTATLAEMRAEIAALKARIG